MKEIDAYQAAYRAAHKEKIAADQAAYHASHKEEKAAYYAAWLVTHKKMKAAYDIIYYEAHKEEKAFYAAAHKLTRKYGISIRDAKMLVSLRDGTGAWCDICRTTEGPFQIDHDHITNRIRGLLCRKCNTALGNIEAGPGISVIYLMSEYVRLNT